MSILAMISLLAGGAIAGALNTLASSGSAITLPLLILLGIPPGIANGTNRLSVLLGSFSAVMSFQQTGSIPWKKTLRLSIPLAAGAILGAGIATQLNDNNIQMIINIAIGLALAVLVIGSKRFISEKST
ncbi:MAG: TSUP family transporter, partial [Gammaproteobacteria bacterium]|nr:TSUP family transporter [Gammaproteobacteria bacterium]